MQAKGAMPAIGVGAIHRNSGARDLSTTDFYLAATRIWPWSPSGRALLLNGGVRSSEAAILGFAGKAAHREALPFASAALVVDKTWTIGAEWMDQPGTDTLRSLFVRVVPDRKQRIHIVIAKADLERIVRAEQQLATSITYRF